MKEIENFLAHSKNKENKPQELSDHLKNVAEKASLFAEKFNSGNWAYNIGLLHDLGKSSKAFQKYLKSVSNNDSDEDDDAYIQKTNHSGAGAVFSTEQYKGYGKVLAYPIAGHHAGLGDWYGGASSLSYRLGNKGDKKYIDQQVAEYSKTIMCNMKNDLIAPKLQKNEHDLHLWIRMLYSCLVDADFLDTEQHINCGQKKRGDFDTLQKLAGKFFDYMQRYDNPVTFLNKIRFEILKTCQNAASCKESFFELTVPTGGGKTLSSVAFAFKHALQFGKKRIIYVIPYTSIIEQTSKVLKDILGEDNVVEHHSNIEPEKETEKSRLACENWDAPVIVTTNVQFFESLYANKPGKCRKLHNIASSTIILDESQMLPPELLYPVEDILRQLADNYKCTVVFSTATQPYFQNLGEIKKIIPDSMDLYNKLKRVEYHFLDANSKKLTWLDISEELKRHRQVLCVVNTRKDCFDLYKSMPEGTIHLSALMCAEHRSNKIALIKEKLKNNEEIRVISTQLIEAGVDIDFPIVYRAFAGLPSIIQSAGRCNREGKLEKGEVFIFDTVTKIPSGIMLKAADATRNMMSLDSFDIDCAEISKKFFKNFISSVNSIGKEALNDKLIKDAYNQVCQFNFQFASYAKEFNIIDDQCNKTVIVNYDEKSKKLLETLKFAGLSKNLLRALQRYVVNIPLKILEEIRSKGLIEEIQSGIFVQDSPFFYKDETGLAVFEENCGFNQWNI